jgi:DNA-binding transcriptional MocR family regulator
MADDVQRALERWRDRQGSLTVRLTDALREAVTNGSLPPGRKLPAERALSGTLRVSRSTVVGAYDQLRSEGWLESRQGSGTFVSTVAAAAHGDVFRANAIFARMIATSGPLIDLSVASPAADPAVLEAARAAGRELEPFTTSPGYFPAGLPALRQEIAHYLEGWGLPAVAEEILVTTGGQQALALVAAEFLRPGEPALVESPTFPGALDALRAAGARLVSVPVGDDGVAPSAVRHLLARTQPRLVYVTPTFNNPTGAMVPAEERLRLARLSGEFQVPLIEDHALADLWYGDQPPPPLGAHPVGGTIVTVGSLSKLFWGGLRVGWVRAPRHVITRLAQRKVVADIAGPVLDQLAAVRLLPRVEEVRARRRAELRARRDLLAEVLTELLPDWSWRLPDGGVCLWAKLPRGDARDLARVALSHGVALVTGPQFAPGEAWVDHVRLPFTTATDQLQEGMRRMARAWAESLPRAGWPAAQQRAVV